MKKLKFKDFLMKHISFWLILIVVICAIGVVVPLSGAYIANDAIFALNISETIGALKDSKSEVENEFILSLYNDYVINGTFTDSATVLCDAETNEIVATSAMNCYAIISKKYSDTGENIYLKNKNEEFRSIVCEYAMLWKENSLIDVEEIYIDGDGFYPGKVSISQLDSSITEKVIGEPREFDFTPENAEDYKMMNEHTIELIAGTAPDSEALKALMENPQTGILDGLFSYNCERENINIGEKKYNLYSSSLFDVWSYASTFFIIMFIAVSVICSVLCFFVSYSKYKKYLTQYEIDEYRRNMTNALAHDLKSPLTAIYGYAENLKNNVHTEKKEYYADAVLENVQYMNEIITNTLDLAKLEISDKGLKKEKVDITALAEELYTKYRPQAESRDISFKISGKSIISVDRKMMTQAMENLISNAVKYTADGGEIFINADTKSFTISNTCNEILNSEKLEKPFEKADSSRSNRSGSGLGLSIVKNIAILHKFGFETKAENNIFTAKITF